MKAMAEIKKKFMSRCAWKWLETLSESHRVQNQGKGFCAITLSLGTGIRRNRAQKRTQRLKKRMLFSRARSTAPMGMRFSGMAQL